jgi:hypothetical protein
MTTICRSEFFEFCTIDPYSDPALFEKTIILGRAIQTEFCTRLWDPYSPRKMPPHKPINL